jgi:hypothetical protein
MGTITSTTKNTAQSTSGISAAEHARAMAGYIREGEARAHALGNRGPIKLDGKGKLDAGILAAYWRHGFYVFEDVIGEEELAELLADVARVLAGAPVAPDAACDAGGNPAIGREFALPSYNTRRHKS